MKNFVFVFATFFICVVAGETLHAQIPRTLSYQGVLTDNAGKPRPDGNYTFKFCLYGSNSGGSPIWCESKSLSVKNGLFSTVLGEQTPFGAAVKFDKQYWLGIQVGSEPELAPRIALTSVGYSFSSLRADTANVSVASLADTTWKQNGSNIYRMNGNVGIGTAQPGVSLDIVNDNYPAVRVTSTGSYGISTGYSLVRQGDDGWHIGTGANDFGGLGGLGFRTFSGKTHMVIMNDGKVGFGTLRPGVSLDIVGDNYPAVRVTSTGSYGISTGYSLVRQGDDGWHIGTGANDFGGLGGLGFRTFSGKTHMVIMNDGKVGFGTLKPGVSLDIVGDNYPSIRVTSTGSYGVVASIDLVRQGDDGWHIGTGGNAYGGAGDLGFRTFSGNTAMIIRSNGTTTTKVLEITGGSDLAEPFEISESQPIPKGALVIIDEENPGRLKLSYQAYDKRVAGVVSGAGGINPGLTLTQQGVLEGGQNVALSGRVYALATATNGPIKPGDLLTTSDVPGHAMKATDFVRWQGAVIGKAMSSLEKGEGLVLVLVNLQ